MGLVRKKRKKSEAHSVRVWLNAAGFEKIIMNNNTLKKKVSTLDILLYRKVRTKLLNFFFFVFVLGVWPFDFFGSVSQARGHTSRQLVTWVCKRSQSFTAKEIIILVLLYFIIITVIIFIPSSLFFYSKLSLHLSTYVWFSSRTMFCTMWIWCERCTYDGQSFQKIK